MSMPIGQTFTQAMQSMQSPWVAASGFGLAQLAARLAPPVAVGDGQCILVHHRALNARPGAGVDADLFAGEAAEEEGGEVRTPW
jgi:hypothetical protein